MRKWVENLSPSIDSVSNDDDICGIFDLNSLVNTTSSCKQFCLCRSNVNNMMNGFG